jgi:hypothetical protein
MSQTELTPAQEAQIPIYISNYTAMSFRTAREGTTDHRLSCAAVERLFKASGDFPKITTYHYLSYIDNANFADLRTGTLPANAEDFDFQAFKKTCQIRKIAKGYQPKQSEYFVICGSWPSMLALARYWSGQTNVTSNLCLAQNAVHAPAYAKYVVDVLKLPSNGDYETRSEEANALHDFSDHCGCTLQYENCTLVGDSPVAFQPEAETGRFRPIFTEKQALELGLELPE